MKFSYIGFALTTTTTTSVFKHSEKNWIEMTQTLTHTYMRREWKRKSNYILFVLFVHPYFPVDTLAQANRMKSVAFDVHLILLCPDDCSHFASEWEKKEQATSVPVMYNKWIEVELRELGSSESNTHININIRCKYAFMCMCVTVHTTGWFWIKSYRQHRSNCKHIYYNTPYKNVLQAGLLDVDNKEWNLPIRKYMWRVFCIHSFFFWCALKFHRFRCSLFCTATNSLRLRQPVAFITSLWFCGLFSLF